MAFCAALSERAPLLLALEDAHWADSGTLALLRHLARHTRRQRFLLVATYREVELDSTRAFQEVLLDLNRERLATRLKLSRLDRESTCELLAALFDEEITPEFLDGIYRETEGNPFFVEEVCKALVESGELYYEDGRWHWPPDMADVGIPQSVRVAIQSRVGVLPPQVQELLRLAAVLGREFDFDTLAAASDPSSGFAQHPELSVRTGQGLDEEALISGLESAEAAQLVQEVSGTGEVTFAFSHGLIPAALVEGVRTLRRRRLQRRAAVAIERLRPEDYEILAYHYAESGIDERALRYYTQAGERAAGAYANVEAEGNLRAALDRVQREADEAHLLSELGVVLARQSRYEDAIETWREGIALYGSLGDWDAVARLYARSARAAWSSGDTPRGLALCREGMAAVAGAPQSVELAELWHEAARACHFIGLPEEAVSLCRQALEMAERLEVVELQAETLTTLGVLHGLPIEESLHTLTMAVELAEDAGLFRQLCRAHNNLGAILEYAVGDLDAARTHYLQVAELARQRGAIADELFFAVKVPHLDLMREPLAVVEEELSSLRPLLEAAYEPGQSALPFQRDQALLLRYRGQVAEAIERLRTLQAQARAPGDLQHLLGMGPVVAEALWELGEGKEVTAVLREAIEISECIGAVPHRCQCRCTLSVQLSRQGQTEAARRLLSAARDEAGDIGMGANAVWAARLRRAEAHLAAAEGHWPEVLAAYEAAADGWARVGARWYRARVLREWAETLLARGEPGHRERARELLREAMAEFEEMGAPIYAAQVQDQLKELDGLS